MHSRVENYKNITAWVKSSITRAVMRIVTMEAMHEDTPTMILFFNLLNEVCRKLVESQNTNSTHVCSMWMKLAAIKMLFPEYLVEMH